MTKQKPKNSRFVRAGEYRFGDEMPKLDPLENPARAEDYELANAGIFRTPSEFLRKVLDGIESEAPTPATESVASHIQFAQGLIKHLPEPPGEPWEQWRAGRSWLLAYAFFSIGSELAAAGYEFGETGEMIAREKYNSEARARGGETQKGQVNQRDRNIRRVIHNHLVKGLTYGAAIDKVRKVWAKEWGVRLALRTLRNRFPKKSFPTQTPREKLHDS